MAALDVRHESRDPAFPDMTIQNASPTPATPTFRKTLIRVMTVQVGALLLLWLLQSHYTA
jgi:hypothetical protein